MKLLISILVHEKPDVVTDEIENIQKFVPEATIVLHLHRRFEWKDKKPLLGYRDSDRVDYSKYDRVLVNPKSVVTLWGNLHHAHHANFHFASKELDFDYFLMHSSSDLFVRSGVHRYIERFDCGVSLVAPQPTFGFNLRAEGDPVYQKIAKDAGAKELWTSQIEGTFYKKELFADLVSRIERHHKFDPSLSYVHEEIYYPTIVSALNVNRGFPYLIREDKQDLPPFGPELIEKIRRGQVEDHYKTRWKLGREVTSQIWEGKELYALRPIPRDYNHPWREYVRGLAV